MGEWTGLTLVLMGAASHGLSYTLGKKGVAASDVLTFSLFRSGAGAISLLVVFLLFGYWEHLQNLPVNYLGLALLSAILNFWTMLGFFWALRLGRLTLMAPLHMSYPLFVFAFGSLFLSEKVTLSLFFGSLGILAGIAIISISQEHQESRSSSAKRTLACLLAVSSSMSWGISLVIDKFLLEHMPPIALNLVKIGAPALGFFLLSRSNGPIPKLRGEELGHAVASGILGLVVANLLYFSALKNSQSVWVAPLSSTSMLFSLIFAILILGERPKGVHLLATVLVFGGVFLISVR
jgi:drug/metabolite transporter (DMT)-like permease